MTSTNNSSNNQQNRRSVLFRYTTGTFTVFAIAAVFLFAVGSSNSGCSVSYKFKDVSIPDSIKVVKVKPFENRASYINTTLTPRLTDRLRQKIVGQTRLKQTNGDDADWEISGTITGYNFSTSGISNQQVATNRLTVSIQMVVDNMRGGQQKKYDVSRSFDFSATQSIQQAEAALADEMTRGLVDDMFNRIFSNWE